MANQNTGTITLRLIVCAGIFILGGCALQNKALVSPREMPPAPVSAEQVPDTASKSLPDLEIKPQQEYGYDHVGQKERKSSLSPESILPPLTLVDDRIIAYEGKMQAWQDISSAAAAGGLQEGQSEKMETCLALIQSILVGYNELHEMLLDVSSEGGAAVTLTNKFVSAEREDISFLESECQQILQLNQQPDAWLAGTRDRLIEEKDKAIAEAMSRGDYSQVIALYEEIPPEDGAKLEVESVYAYGQALLRTGSAEKAGRVLQDLLGRIRRESLVQKEFSIMKLVADISFGLEDYNRAFERYGDIVNRYQGFSDNVEWAHQQQSLISSRNERGTEVRSFADLLLSYLTYTPGNDGYRVAMLARNFSENYPDSPLNAAASRIFMETRDRADAWFTGVVDQINRFRAEKKYGEALAFIEQLPRVNLLPDKQEQLRALTDDLISSQFEVAETMRIQQEKELEETWNTALAHLRAKEYDQAIDVFSTLLATEYGDRAGMQIEEASQLAVQEDRRQAAELFVRANRATDLDTKIGLLLESRRLLQDILIKYPQSELVDKVRRNMSRIEEEIAAIDPDLLNTAAGENPSGDAGALPERLPAGDSPAVPGNGQDELSPVIRE